MVSFGGLVRAKSVTRFSWLSVVAEAEVRAHIADELLKNESRFGCSSKCLSGC